MVRKSAGQSGIFWANARVDATRVGDLLCLKHDKFIGRSLNLYGEWAQHEIDRLLQYIKPGDFVIDVGANIGFHTLSFARQVGQAGSVWAFEPDPVNGILLRLNILNSGLDSIVIPFDLALSDATALCRFRSYPISMPENFGHTAIDEKAGDYPRVALRLDAIDIERPAALIKIDIEGHELLALDGMRALIEKHRPVLSIEADTEQEAETLSDMLCELGYDTYDFVTNAFNPDNFAGREDDIWKGHGRCSNLLCIVPGVHERPEGLTQRRSAAIGGGMSRISRKVSVAYAAGMDSVAVSAPDRDSPVLDLRGLRADVRGFVSGFLRSAIGRLDPDRYGDLIHSALDYLAAETPQSESNALRKTLIAGVDSFGRAVTQAYEVEAQLAKFAQELEASNRLRQDLEMQLESAGQAAAELADAQQQLAESRAETQDALGKADILKNAMNEMNAVMARQASSGTEEIKRLQEEVGAVRADLAAEREASQKLRTSQDEAEKQLKSQREADANEIRRLQEDMKAVQAEFAEERQKLRASQDEAEKQLKAQREADANEIRRLQENMKAAQAELAAERQKLRESQDEAEKQLKSLREVNAVAQDKLAEAVRATHQIEKERGEAAEQVAALETDLADALAKIKELAVGQGRVDELMAVHEALTEGRNEAVERMAALEAEMVALRAEHAAAQERLVSQSREIRRLRAAS